LSDLLTNLTPLAFISSSPGPAKAAQLYNTDADIFFYAVASQTQSNQPDTLYLLYDDTAQTNANLMPGQLVAEFSLPLTVLGSSGASERQVPATLQFRATLAGDCSTSTVVGDFSGASSGSQTLMAAHVGVNCAVVFAPSPLSTTSHAIFEVAVPLTVTKATDPLYFSNPIVSVGSPFLADEIGFTPAPATPPILGANGKSIGIGPAAVPLCTPATCPTPPTTPPAPVLALCANLPGGSGYHPVPAVAAYYAISTAGEALLSAALPSVSTSVCPF
jgi:hypothetical protein